MASAQDDSSTTVDDLLLARASEEDQIPFVAYPCSTGSPKKYNVLTARDMSRLTDYRILDLEKAGLKTVGAKEPAVIALLGPSNVSYMINMFALSRLGYSVLILSSRLSVDAYLALFAVTNCNLIVYATTTKSTVSKLKLQRPLFGILSDIDFETAWASLNTMTSPPKHSKSITSLRSSNPHVAFILHSSGSTGIPKPIYQTHQSCFGSFSVSNPPKGFCTVPLYHAHGHAVLYRTLLNGGTLYMFDAALPLTSRNLISALQIVQPQTVYAVPYVLKLLAESKTGVEALRASMVVSSSGSQCPDELGDYLVSEGVNLVCLFGSTETGSIMSSKRPKGDNAWNYMRLYPSALPYIYMKPLDAGTFEMVALDGLQSKAASNSDDPPKSFHSRDLFTPHSSIANAWKYLGRLDDRVNLINGEKVLPLPIEGRIRKEALIREAVVFGTGRDRPGLLLFRSADAHCMSDEEFITSVWPAIEDANSKAEAFSQISRDMVVPVSDDISFPQTDKGTIIRAQLYKAFADLIEAAYAIDPEIRNGGTKVFELQELKQFLRHIFKEQGILVENDEADFFISGLDSLKAIQIASMIRQEAYLGKFYAKLNQNIIFERRNIDGLAQFIIALQSGEILDEGAESIDFVQTLIEKYSEFERRKPNEKLDYEGKTIFLTGCTGSLGAHILKALLHDDGVKEIYCPTRSLPSETPMDRIISSLSQIGESPDSSKKKKIIPMPSSLGERHLGLCSDDFKQLEKNISLIIHCAWPVNFNLSVQSFEAQHIKGLQNLLQLSLAAKRPNPVRFVFCSSVSVATNSPPNSIVPEEVISDVSYVQNTGYAHSKYVAEHIISNVVKQGADCCILRIGQIVGDSISGRWNAQEATPLIIRTADTLACLPALNEDCSWLPVDTVARTVLDIADAKDTRLLYNVINPRTFNWTTDLLPKLHQAGLEFKTVPPEEWFQRLHDSDQNPNRNPSIRLIAYFAQKLDKWRGAKSESIRFATTQAEQTSETLSHAPDVIAEGYIQMFVDAWRKDWAEATI